MGDWNNNLEYEQREYYGHFYDTDEDVHEEEETDDLISKQKVLNTLDFADNALDEERTVEKYKELLTECIKVLPSVENKGENKSKGHWKRYPNNYPYIWKCDKCESLFKMDFNFCPRCGADMRGET